MKLLILMAIVVVLALSLPTLLTGCAYSSGSGRASVTVDRRIGVEGSVSTTGKVHADEPPSTEEAVTKDTVIKRGADKDKIIDRIGRD